jgi:hypothetical protein
MYYVMLMHQPNGPSEIEVFCYNVSINEICKNLCISCGQRQNTADEILLEGEIKNMYTQSRMSSNQNKAPKNIDRTAFSISPALNSLSKEQSI